MTFERQFAYMLSKKSLEEEALKYTLQNFLKVFGTTARVEFNQLSCSSMEELISHDWLNVSEENVFKAIVKWISFKPKVRLADLSK